MMCNQFYSWRGAILKSGMPPTTRHVLLTLACHMNDAGESCYPSIELLCEETGLSNRAVITHLQKAADAGWIVVDKHGFKGQKWARKEYKIAWPEIEPDDKKVVNDVHYLSGEGSEPDDKKVVNDVHTNYTKNYPEVVTSVTTTTPRTREQQAQDSSPRHEGELACRLIKLNVSVTSMHPILISWVQDKIPIDLIDQCVSLARQQKPWPERIPARYLDSIIRNELKPKRDMSWLMSDEATVAKGQEVGIEARIGETMQDYRSRLKASMESANDHQARGA